MTQTVTITDAPPVVRRKRARRKLTFDRVSFFVVFLGLPLAIFLLFVVWPFVQAFYYSLTDWSGFTPERHFTGLSNYRKLFTDDIFLHAMRNSITLVIVLPIVTIVLALILASLVTVGGPSHGPVRGLRNSSFYRVVSFFPYVIPAIIIGIMWSQIYDPSNGILNGALRKLGFHRFESYPWLGDQSTAMIATMFVIVWGLVGFYMYMGILALDAFVYMDVLNPGGGPNNSTLVMSQRLFTTAFTKGQFGYACAMGVVLAVITLLFSAVVFLVNRLTGGNNDVAE